MNPGTIHPPTPTASLPLPAPVPPLATLPSAITTSPAIVPVGVTIRSLRSRIAPNPSGRGSVTSEVIDAPTAHPTSCRDDRSCGQVGGRTHQDFVTRVFGVLSRAASDDR